MNYFLPSTQPSLDIGIIIILPIIQIGKLRLTKLHLQDCFHFLITVNFFLNNTSIDTFIHYYVDKCSLACNETEISGRTQF